jgi:hypothetical protein
MSIIGLVFRLAQISDIPQIVAINNGLTQSLTTSTGFLINSQTTDSIASIVDEYRVAVDESGYVAGYVRVNNASSPLCAIKQ